jgi:Protein of unknown function (DUF1524)
MPRGICSLALALCFAIVIAVPNAVSQPNPLAGIRIAPEARVSYERARDYGDWMRMSAPYNRCFNVRDQVLSDESRRRLRVKRPSGTGWRCTITAGLWNDPYTGKRFTNPKHLDVDHVVPLKEAHQSGAHRWSRDRRREYANELRDPKHLLAVSLAENRRKGDRDPPNYMPRNTAFHCRYLEYWIAIKRRWNLSMDRVEAAFIRRRLAAC